MTWHPVDLAASEAAFKLEILRAARDGRIRIAPDPDNHGRIVYRYDEQPGDEWDGQFCTDEVCDLARDGLLEFVRGGAAITDKGRAFLEERVR